jgi:Flp pilus assembly pilin Flp
MSFPSKLFGRFRRQESGSATIEFVLLFPVIIALFMMGFESGYYMVRNVMLERAVDIAVRDVRLGNGRVPNFDDLKVNICNNAGLLPDCVNSIQIEMQEVAITPGGTVPMQTDARCVDRMSTDDSLTGTTYDVGQINSMMIVRVCTLQQPLFPTTSIGAGLGVDIEGNYAMVATSAFVTEPGTRAFAAPLSSGGGSGGGSGSGSGDGSLGSDS